MFRSCFAAVLVVGLAGRCLAQTEDEVAAARLLYIDGDYATALEVLRPAAEAGNANAQNLMGDAYDTGSGVELDPEQARIWWERAAAQDFDKAVYNLGLYHAEGRDGVAPDYAKAIEYYERAIALGYPWAMNNRARMHDQGLGGPADPEAAAALYAQAAEMGLPIAQNNLGLAYLHADGVDEDLGRAVGLFREAAAGGYMGAVNNLGAAYVFGYGVAPDPMAALALYRMAAERGAPQAALNMAYMLIEDAPEAWRDPTEGWAWCLAALDRATADHDFADDCEYLRGLLDDATIAAGEAMAPGLPR